MEKDFFRHMNLTQIDADFSFFRIYMMSLRHSNLSSYIPQGPPVFDPRGCRKLRIMWTLYHKIGFLIRCQRKSIKVWFLRFSCIFHPKWHYIKHGCISTTAKILKLNEIYAYKETGYLDIVRLVDINFDKGFLFCSLYFFSKNKVITVSQIMQKDAYVIWHLLENEEYDEIMSRKLRHHIEKQDELLDFRF